jgi:hypothetical protein
MLNMTLEVIHINNQEHYQPITFMTPPTNMNFNFSKNNFNINKSHIIISFSCIEYDSLSLSKKYDSLSHAYKSQKYP